MSLQTDSAGAGAAVRAGLDCQGMLLGRGNIAATGRHFYSHFCSNSALFIELTEANCKKGWKGRNPTLSW